MPGKVIAVSLSARKGMRKEPQSEVDLIVGSGVQGDAHAGPGLRQVSLLAQESGDKMRAAGLVVGPGSFAENITTVGIELPVLAIGRRLAVGQEAVLEVSQIGKECHERCAIYREAGDCVMPREGIFAQVRRGGKVRPGDSIVPLD